MSDANESSKTTNRRSVLKTLAGASTGLVGASSLIQVGSSSASAMYTGPDGGGGIETLDANNTKSSGDVHRLTTTKGDVECAETELAIGSALDEDSTPYRNGPGPVFCNWGAHIKDGARTRINDLTLTVEIENANAGYNFSNHAVAKRKAPSPSGFKPSFSVSVGLLGVGFGVGFSPTGGKTSYDNDLESVTEDFGSVCDLVRGPAGNTGWIRVDLVDPNEDSWSAELRVSADAHVWGGTAGPGPRSDYDDHLHAEETFNVVR